MLNRQNETRLIPQAITLSFLPSDTCPLFCYTIHITILFKVVTVMGKHFSEDSRVKIPALMHLSRLGYQYLSTKEIRTQVHKSTNIFPPLPAKGSEQASKRQQENRHLTALRDFLLPLLMNGQVGFKNPTSPNTKEAPHEPCHLPERRNLPLCCSQ